MYASYFDEEEENDSGELTYEIVGALMRRFKQYSHVSKSWGDPLKDSEIPNLDELAARYNYQSIMAWILEHPDVATESYSEKFSVRWNTSDAVGVSVSETGMTQMLIEKDSKFTPLDMKSGTLSVLTPLENLNHQLASLIVASFPPEKVTGEDGVIKCKPCPCDQQGLYGPSRQYLPYIKFTGKPSTAGGGPIMQAYTTQGGTESIVARVETALNKPIEGTPLKEHKAVVASLARSLEKLKKNKAKFPKWYDPFTTEGEAPRIKLLREINYKPYTTLDAHYIAYTYMATTCGITKRAAYVFDGHYFGDMPAGMAPKIHRLNNLMNCVHYLKSPGVSMSVIPKPIQSLKPLLPLNLPCFTMGANVKLTEDASVGFDQRFRPGVFKHPGVKTANLMVFREMVTDRPMLKEGKIVYSPSNPAHAISESIKAFPYNLNAVVFITVAHPTLWEDPKNFIYPFDLLTGDVMVVRGSTISSSVAGHVPYKVYLNKVSYFMQSRVMYPYSRVSWPQLSEEPFSRIMLKRGSVSASDTAYSFLKAQMDDSEYTWEASELYAEAKDTEVAPPPAQKKLIKVPPKAPVVPVPPPQYEKEEEGDPLAEAEAEGGGLHGGETDDEADELAAMMNAIENDGSEN